MSTPFEQAATGGWSPVFKVPSFLGHEIYVVDFKRKEESLCIAAVQVFGECTDRVLRLKLPFVHGEITVDLKPAQAAEASPRFTKMKAAVDEIRPIAKWIELPKSFIKVIPGPGRGAQGVEHIWYEVQLV